MAKQPENSFIQAVHKKLPSTVYYEKMHNIFRGGTPDCYYEGAKNNLWIEYKWSPTTPTSYKLNLSALQLRWLKRSAENNRAPWVILGWKRGRQTSGSIFITPQSWVIPHLHRQHLSVAEIAERITHYCAY